MTKFRSLEQTIVHLREELKSNKESSGRFRSLEASIRGVLRKENSKPEDKLITGDELDSEDLKHSRVADLQKKNKIIDNP